MLLRRCAATGSTPWRTSAATALALLTLGPVGALAQPPGPSLLHEAPPAAPQLSVQPPFAAAPLLVSGTDALRGGEYLYQDHLFDDRGADTVPGPGSRFENGRNAASPTAGDVLYPTAARYGGNAADLVELRIRPVPDAIVYRVTLNTARAPDAAVVGIGIDTDRAGGTPVAWPRGAGLTSPGLDAFVTAWGTGGETTDLATGTATPLPAGAVTIDLERNQMTIRVPRTAMDPGPATWRYVAGTGLWDGAGWIAPSAAAEPTGERPASGSPARSAPAVLNLAFRFDEPQAPGGRSPYTTAPGIGHWHEEEQARVLGEGTSGAFHADVDFAALAAGREAWAHAPGRRQARIFASRFEPYEGVRAGFPGYGTRLQPYTLSVPPDYAPGRPSPLTLALHSGSSSHTQYAVGAPGLLRQLGDERGSLVLTPFARGPDSVYLGIGEADVYEAWRDAAAHFDVDAGRVALAGYSIGGYGAYRVGLHHPDLFARVFTGVAQPGVQAWVPPAPPVPGGEVTNTNPLLENARWVPLLQWAQAVDELNPYPGPRAQQDRFASLGLRSELWTFTSGEHFTLATGDEWAAARDFLGDARVVRDPSRVDYAFLPQADAPDVGLRHDHAYWVSGLRARVAEGDPRTAPARGEVSARSHAFGEGAPAARRVAEPGSGHGPPTPTAVDGVAWDAIAPAEARNAVDVDLDNVVAATLDGRRARLDGRRELRVTIASDGPGRLRLDLPLPAGVRADPDAETGADGATFAYAAGTRTWVLRPASAAGAAPAVATRGDDPQADAPRRGARRRPAADRSPARAHAGSGDALPFTGLDLQLLALGGALLAGLGLGLRPRRTP